MKIYVDITSLLLIGKEDKNFSKPLCCNEYEVSRIPFYWGVGWYIYNGDNNYSLTNKGSDEISKKYNVPVEVHYVEYSPLAAQKKIDLLWQICTDYQNVRIDANGLIGMSFKATQGGKKAMANVQWVQILWSDYFSRKQQIKISPLATINMSFNDHGDPPYSFYEANQE